LLFFVDNEVIKITLADFRMGGEVCLQTPNQDMVYQPSALIDCWKGFTFAQQQDFVR